MKKEYQGKLVFVTGASEGIGKEVAKAFTVEGAHLHVFSRSGEKLALAFDELEALRRSGEQGIFTHRLDVTDEAQCREIIDAVVAQYGVPDYVINCAGFARAGYIDEMPLKEYREMMELNYFGLVNVCKAVVPHLVQARRGHIVNTSSMAGFIGLFGYTGYCASKFAVVGFTEALRRELAPSQVKVSVLCPPNTRTPGLVEENRTKPTEVLKTEEKAKPVDPSQVAASLLRALPRNSFFIHPTFDGRVAHVLSRFLPSVLTRLVKRD